MDNMYSDQRIVSHRTIDSHIKKLRKKLTVSVPMRILFNQFMGLVIVLFYNKIQVNYFLC